MVAAFDAVVWYTVVYECKMMSFGLEVWSHGGRELGLEDWCLVSSPTLSITASPGL